MTIGAGLVNVTTPVLQYGGSTALPCTTQITASDTTITPDSVSVTVNPAPSITMFALPADVGAGLQVTSRTARLGASQHGGVTMRLESSDPGTMLLAPDATTAGTPFIEVSVPNGQTDVTYVIQGVENALGTATVTASAAGFSDGSGQVTIVQPALRFESLTTTGIDTLDVPDEFFVRLGIPNGSATNLAVLQQARTGGGGFTVTLTSSVPSVAELQTQTATGQIVTVQVPEGQNFSPTTFATGGVRLAPLNVGTTTITGTIPNFITTAAANVDVPVTAPGITLSGLPTDVGAGLQRSNLSVILGAAQHGGVTLRLESSNPSLVVLAPNSTTAGTGFVEFTIPNGSTSAGYTVQGLEGASGAVTITASAAGFTDGTAQVNVVQPSLRLEQLSTSIDTLDPDDPFFIRLGIANSLNTNLAQLQEARFGGGGVPVTLSSSVASVGEFVTNTATGPSVIVTVPEGQNFTPTTVASGGIAFRSLATGTTNVNASIPGINPITTGNQDVVVTAPGIAFFGVPATVGAGLQRGNFVAALAASQHGGVTLRIESSDPTLALLAPNGTTVGTNFVEFVLANGTTNATFTVQGVEGTSGTATLTATATGFSTGVAQVDIVQPALRIEQLASDVDTLDADDAFFIRTGPPNATGTNLSALQEARVGGGGLTVNVTNSNATSGELVTTAQTGQAVTVTIPEGQNFSPTTVAAGGVAFSPLTTGNTTVSAAIAGFTTTDAGSVDITVDAPEITLFSLPTTIGSGLQASVFTASLGASQHGGVTVRIESSNPSVVLVAPDGSTAGTPFIEVPLANGQTNVFYTIQGLENTTGTVTLTATAAGFTDGSGAVTVAPAGLRLEGLSATIDPLGVNDDFLVRVGTPNASQSNLASLQDARVGGGGLTATITNSEAAFAQLLSPVTTGQVITVTIPEGQSFSPTTLAGGGSAIEGLQNGVTLVSATIPNFVSTAAASQSVTVEGGITIPPGELNLTQLPGTTAVSSSDFPGNFGAANAIDLTNQSSWCTANNDPAPALTINFPSDVTVTSIQMRNLQFDPTFSFLTGTYRILDSGGGQLFTSGVVPMTEGGVDLLVSPAISGARAVEFTGASWNSIEPCLSEFGVTGTSP